MKKLYTRFALAVLSLTFPIAAIAQIPNNGFENWSTDGNGDFNPDNWLTTNSDPFYGVTQYTPAYAGNYSMKTAVWSPGFGAIAGIAYCDFIYTQRPTTLDVCLKSNVMPGDICYITLALWSGDTVVAGAGACTYPIDTTYSTYTCFSFPITYASGVYPDSATIMVIGGGSSAQMGTYIIVDQMSFGFLPIGIEEGANADYGTAFPNPSAESVNIPVNLNAPGNVTINIFDINGQLVRSESANDKPAGSSSTVLSVTDLSNGIYSYQVISNEGLSSGSFVVARK